MLIGHSKQWEFLKNKLDQGQLSHAYLFTGSEGIGKKLFAKEFVKYINCIASPKPEAKASQDKSAPCQKCFSCQAIERESFPDFMLVSPQEGGEVQISQIKQVQNFLSYKSYYGSYRAVIVDDAEEMNQEAQSCFLKTLEEPKGQTLIILISSMPDMFLGTISSRCQAIKFFKPRNLPVNVEKMEKEQGILNQLLPIMNSTLADKFKYVKSLNFEQQKLGDILEVMQKHFRNLLLEKVGINEGNNPTPRSLSATGVAAEGLAIQKVKNIINLIENIHQKSLFTNANPKLALEIILMEL